MKKGKTDFSTKYIGAMQIFFTIVTILIFLFFLIGAVVLPGERDGVSSECQAYEGNWQQILDNGERVFAEIPGRVAAEYGEVVTLVTQLPHDTYSGQYMCFKTIWQDVEVYIDGELRKSYNTKNSRLFGTNSTFRYVFVELEQEDAGKEMIYQFSSDSKYTGFVHSVYIGDRASIWFYLMKQSGVRFGIAVFLLILSLFCIIICAIFKLVYKKRLTLMHMSWAIFFSAVWVLSEVEIRQLLFHNVSLISNYTYWSLILISFPTLFCMNEYQKGRYQKFYSISLAYSTILFVFGTFLQVFDIVQFVHMLPFIHFGTALANSSILITITIDTYKRYIRDYLLVGIGFYGVLVTTLIELALYYTKPGFALGSVFSFGLAFILMMAIVDTIQELLYTEKKRQQTIAQKEAQARFLANMSHEIRTPINAVIGMNEMIMRESNDEAIQRYAHNIQSASNMLLGLINDVLDFSKIESGQLELVEDTYSFATVIQDEWMLLHTRIGEKPILAKIDIDENLPSGLYGDELRIKQVLTNLLSNAVKYTKEGSVTLKVFFQWVDDETIKLCFAVKDTGIGIKKEDLGKLFDSFKRLELNKNRNIEGTGLGLNIAKQLVELMQGNISVESEYGKGSVFYFSIPQKVMDKQPIGSLEQALQRRKQEEQKEKRRIIAPDTNLLVVDDNEMNVAVMQELLKNTEINVDVAFSGEECLKHTKNKHYDIILMDHMMPQMDGIETLHRLREDENNLNRNTVVIALTANAIAGSREMYLEQGFQDYFAKPINGEKLDSILRQYLTMECVDEENESKQNTLEEPEKVSEDLIHIDYRMGMSYCMDSEEMYETVLLAFCKQAKKYLPLLEEHVQKKDWKQYAVIAHGLKGNALNIGAVPFSELSLQHELAGKREDEAFIQKEYGNYTNTLNGLIQKIDWLCTEN